MTAKTRKCIGLIITNSQNMYICDNSLLLQYLTLFEHIYLSFLVLTVAEGGSNDIYDVVSIKAKGRALVDLCEIFAIY